MTRREHFVVALDRARIRIYRETRRFGQSYQNLELVEAIDFPEPDSQPFPNEERLSLEREHGRRRANDLAAELDVFLSNRPAATWDLAAGPTTCRAVLARLSGETRKRLRRSVVKDLAKRPVAELHLPAA